MVIQTSPLRNYVYDSTACHVIGYLGHINKKELTKLRNYGYQRRDLIGRSGVEKYYDNYLKGKDGGSQLEVNNRGRQLRMLGIKEAVAGKDISLTIDIDLQVFIEESMGGHRGAIVVMDSTNGEILGMLSRPGFDPDMFVSGASPGAISSFFKRSDFPLVNRAISGRYPPGSVFKVVVASAALDKEKINTRTHLGCKGSYTLGRRVFRCWKKKGHGSQNIREAIKNSCNVFFYQMGRIAGADNITEFAKKFGFGKSTGIDLPGEVSGLVPGRMWKMMSMRENWYEGDTVNFSIGQGYLLVTPLQIVRMMAASGNGGRLIRPHVVKRIDVVDAASPDPKPIRISKEALEIVKEGLDMVVNAERGTGRKARVKGLDIGGKTGTAQAGKDKTHAWFSGFSPVDDAKMAVVVFLEHGGKGGLSASKIAGEIFGKLHELGYL